MEVKGVKMRNFEIKRTCLIATLIIAMGGIFTPLQAWIDHIFDFHFDRKDAGLQFDHETYDGKSDVEEHVDRFSGRSSERSADRENDRGTTLDGPDRDRG